MGTENLKRWKHDRKDASVVPFVFVDAMKYGLPGKLAIYTTDVRDNSNADVQATGNAGAGTSAN